MVKIVKKCDEKRKEPSEHKKKREYEAHKKRLDKLSEEGLLEEFLDGHSRGRDIAKRAKINRKALARETPPHDLQQLRDGCQSYFKSIDNEKETIITKEGEIKEVKMYVPMTIEGLMRHLGITRYWFDKYESDESLAKYRDVMEVARLRITENVLVGGLIGKFNPNLVKFYLPNISKLKEKPDANADSGINTINFITVNSKEELQSMQGEIIDITAEED